MKRYNTVSVPTNTLKVGDTFIAHGGLFRVEHIHVDGDCHANYSRFLGNAYESECAIPKAWRSNLPAGRGRPEWDNFWNQQGNGLARTARIIESFYKLGRETGYAGRVFDGILWQNLDDDDARSYESGWVDGDGARQAEAARAEILAGR